MLKELSVQNLALIEDIQVEMEGGFSAWTGETGAGKSLLLTALGLVLGGKASSEMVRAGKTEARAAAVFDLAAAATRGEIEEILGGPLEDDALIVTRRVSAQGRSTAQVNGLPVTIGTLQKLGERLVDLHGQHEGLALLDPDRQRELLDAFGGVDNALDAYRQTRDQHDTLRRRRLELIARSQDRQRERALLEFERDELGAADPKPGEYEELIRESHVLGNAEALRTAATEGYARLYEADQSAQGFLKRVARTLEPLAAAVPELAEAAATLQRLADETKEVAYTLRDLGERWDDDPRRLEDLEARLALYRRLATRFHCTPDELAARRTAAEAKLASIEQDESDLKSLDAPLSATWDVLKVAAEALSTARRRVAKTFGKDIQDRLKPLGLENARLTVEVQSQAPGEDFTAAPPPESGIDHVEMMFLANPGETPRPLRKVASGGELSRVTLAAKTVLAGADRVPTLIFDEIDTGVGGRMGAPLGKMLAELSRHHQVICVTHLPQLACHASRQWAIRKQTLRGRTTTTIRALDDAARVEELAAMLRGESAAEGTRQEAQAMLAEAQAVPRTPSESNGRGRRR